MKNENLITLLETRKIGRETAQFITDDLHFNLSGVKDLLGHIEDLKLINQMMPILAFSDLEFAFER